MASEQALDLSQQTRHIYPMFDHCWPTFYDVGPALVKNWVDVSCLFEGYTYIVARPSAVQAMSD